MKKTKEGKEKKGRFLLPPPPGSLLIITPDYGFRPPPPRPPSGSVLFPFIDCALLLPDFAAGLLLGCGEHNGTRQRALFPLAHFNNYAFFAGILLLLLDYRNTGPFAGTLLLLDYRNTGPFAGTLLLLGYRNTGPFAGTLLLLGYSNIGPFAGTLLLLGYSNIGPFAGLLEHRAFCWATRTSGLLLGYCMATGTEDLCRAARTSGLLLGYCMATGTEDLCRAAAGLPEQRIFAGILLLLRWGLLSLLSCQSRHGRRPRPEEGKTQPCCASRSFAGRGLPHPGKIEARQRRHGRRPRPEEGKRNPAAPADPLLVGVCPTPGS